MLSDEQQYNERFAEITGPDAEFVKVDQAALFDMILVRRTRKKG